MIRQPSLPTGNVLFCDDIRHEVTGKQTLVGVYNGALVAVTDDVAEVPQLFVRVTFRYDPRESMGQITFKVIREEETNETIGEISVNTADEPLPPTFGPLPKDPDTTAFIDMTLVMALGRLVFERDCLIKVRAYTVRDEFRLGVLAIQITRPEKLSSAG